MLKSGIYGDTGSFCQTFWDIDTPLFFPIYGLTSIGKSHRKYEFGEEETWDPVLEANSKIGLRR